MKQFFKTIGLILFWGIICLNYFLIMNVFFDFLYLKTFIQTVPNEKIHIIILFAYTFFWFKMGWIDKWIWIRKQKIPFMNKWFIPAFNILGIGFLVLQTGMLATPFLFFTLLEYIYLESIHLTYESIIMHHIIWTLFFTILMIIGAIGYIKRKKMYSEKIGSRGFGFLMGLILILIPTGCVKLFFGLNGASIGITIAIISAVILILEKIFDPFSIRKLE